MDTVETYLRNAPQERRAILEHLRELVLKTIPDASETLRYKMPTYERGEHIACAFASQKHYISLYLDTELLEKYGAAFAHLETGKSCVRFKRLEDLPQDTIVRILQETVVKQDALNQQRA